MSGLKYVIFAPRNLSGGAIVLHNLCKLLNECGQDAVIFPSDFYWVRNKFFYLLKWIPYILRDTVCLLISKVFRERVKNKPYFQPYLSFPVKGIKKTYFPFVSQKTVVVYSELVWKNPLNAKRTVRWFLYHNPYKGNEQAFGKDDLFFAYRPVFNDSDLNPTCRTLHTSYFDFDTYKRTNYGERSGKCYILRKGGDRSDLPQEFDGPVIDNLTEAEKVKILNQCQWCISYDTQTAYSSIAALCGCISVVVPEPGKTKADYRTTDDSDLGVAFGFSEEEINHAIQTRDLVYDHLQKQNKESANDIKNFVKVCEEYFQDK